MPGVGQRLPNTPAGRRHLKDRRVARAVQTDRLGAPEHSSAAVPPAGRQRAAPRDWRVATTSATEHGRRARSPSPKATGPSWTAKVAHSWRHRAQVEHPTSINTTFHARRGRLGLLERPSWGDCHDCSAAAPEAHRVASSGRGGVLILTPHPVSPAQKTGANVETSATAWEALLATRDRRQAA